MKYAQTIIEFIMITLLAVIIVGAIVTALKLEKFSKSTIYGGNTKGPSFEVKPMTP
jgi:type IV secretory pathway component VirB8